MLLQALPRVSHAPLTIINSSNSRTKLLLYCARSPGTRAIKLLKSRLRSVLLTAGLLSGASVIAHPATAEETTTATSESQEEIIQRILELRGEIEELLELLPAEMREEVERRWRDRQQVDLAPQSEPEARTEVEPEGQQESPTTPAAQPELPEEPARTAEPEPEVTPASADRTTTGRAARCASMIPATARIRSASATEVPPNFITIKCRTSRGAGCGRPAVRR